MLVDEFNQISSLKLKLLNCLNYIIGICEIAVVHDLRRAEGIWQITVLIIRVLLTITRLHFQSQVE